MKNNTNYFSHDGNAHDDPKIVKLGMRFGYEGVGLYRTINEYLFNEGGYMSNDIEALAYLLRYDVDKLGGVFSYMLEIGLYDENDGVFFSQSLLRRLHKKAEKKRKLSEAGKRGNAKRWGSDKSKGSPPDRHPIASKVKESKVKETKEKKKRKKVVVVRSEEEAIKYIKTKANGFNADNLAHKNCIVKFFMTGYVYSSGENLHDVSDWLKSIALEYIGKNMDGDVPRSTMVTALNTFLERLIETDKPVKNIKTSIRNGFNSKRLYKG